MTTLVTTLMTTLHGTVHGPAPEHRVPATTMSATPVRVDVTELAGSVVLLTPGRSLVVSARDAARWCATADDTSVAAVQSSGHGHGHGHGHGRVPADGEAVVCTVQATAPGRTRGHLVDPSGQRRPFEVLVIAPDSAPDSVPAAHRALRSSRPSWAVRLRRALLPTGRPLSVVTTSG